MSITGSFEVICRERREPEHNTEGEERRSENKMVGKGSDQM
jgi:hypothetical protein